MASIGGEEGGVMVEGGNLIATEVNCPIEHLQFVSVRLFLKRCALLVMLLRNSSALPKSASREDYSGRDPLHSASGMHRLQF